MRTRSFARAARPKQVAAVVWLLGLCLYVLAGVPLATFHGDEAMQIHMSRDYTVAFVDGRPEALVTNPPYPIDSDGQLRILNGSINRYTIGLSLSLAGFSPADLPPAPGWDWGLSYGEGVASGYRPAPDVLLAARLPSALFLCASVVVMFALGRLLGPAWLAFVASGLYALHPVILLNGRRAMQEGSLLCFGLLAVLAAALIARRRYEGETSSPIWWSVLVVAGGLSLASKHSGIVFVAGAFVWLLAVESVTGRQWRPLAARLTLSGLVILALFVSLSPALWSDPLARFRDLLAVRQELIDIQVAIDPAAPTSLPRRVADVVMQPFIAPVIHYELPTWGEDTLFLDEIAAYMASPLSGIHFGLILGVPLTLLAGFGLVRALQSRRHRFDNAGLVAWLLVTVASLLVNPLPWQRYYLPLIPVIVLLVSLGLRAAVRLLLPATPS